MIPQRWLILCSAMCSAGLLWSAVLIAALLAGVRLVPTAVAVAVAAVLTVPGVIAGVLGNRWLYRTTRPRVRWNLTSWVPPHVPHWAGMLAGVFFFGFWLTVVMAFAGLDGDIQMRGGQYVRSDDGRTTVVSQADFDRHRSLEQQISLGILGAAAVGGVFMTGAILTHHAAPQPTETQSAGQALA
ncbi:hypothetical protein [Paractinoplanes brasiliensis]|uniref:Uncharacterized protein n=1 Tax=Paractinoplanes brasiliensis TaxID=52695 RepID=A0A4R6JY04_9ACTN|nr:hypothetical protein [Actinoplanes brasiliensis]TDO41723.1 hypothetical protein C8E87_5462 [Actinoplanes brasiliensis]GID33362.1 hypothetical protein Abr02nite_83450 [Actinoplanes brasiliensis]